MDEDVIRELIEEIKLIKKILLHKLLSEQSKPEKIKSLLEIGISSSEIAKITNSTPSSVRMAKTRLKRKSK